MNSIVQRNFVTNGDYKVKAHPCQNSHIIHAMKQRWINELAKYDFSLEYQKDKNNTVADALSRISKEHLSDEKAKRVLEGVPVIPGDDTVFEVLKEKEEDQ